LEDCTDSKRKAVRCEDKGQSYNPKQNGTLNRKSKRDVAVMANLARMKKIGTEIVHALTPVGADVRVSNDYTGNAHDS
jgi:hypothetical protein